MAAYAEFEFDLPGALLVRLVETLDGLGTDLLNVPSLLAVPEEQGVYQLFLDGSLVYVGKTDAEAGLRKRLSRHAKKILFRTGLDPARVSFKAVRIFVFTALDLESSLIAHYGGVKALAWNGSGFGSNDPGRERDTTKVEAHNYDAMFPIDIDRPLPFSVANGESVADALRRLKDVLPFTLRFQGRGGRGRKAHSDLETSIATALSGPVSTRSCLLNLLASVPSGWQATALKGYVILYKEHEAYPSAQAIMRSP